MPTFLHGATLWWIPIALFLVAALTYLGHRNALLLAEKYGDLQLIGRFSQLPTRKGWAHDFLGWGAAVTLIIVSLSDPQVTTMGAATAGSLRIVVVVDTSKSMAVEAYKEQLTLEQQLSGLRGTNLDMVQEILVRQVLPATIGNRIGMVKYVGEAIIQEPITSDYTAFIWITQNWLKMKAPGGGSDVAAGLEQALETFALDEKWNGTDVASGADVIVLFSDGGYEVPDNNLAANKEQRLEKVLADIRQRGIKVIVVGLGPDSPMSVPLYNERGEFVGYYKTDDKVALTQLDERRLQNIADTTGGQYIRFKPGVSMRVDWAERAAGKDSRVIEKQSIYYAPLAVAALIVLYLLTRANLLLIMRRLGKSSAAAKL